MVLEDFVTKPSANNLRRCFNLFLFKNKSKSKCKKASALIKLFYDILGIINFQIFSYFFNCIF